MCMFMCIHMSDELKVINELIKEATRINTIRRKFKKMGFTDKEVFDMVEHFVVEQIQKPLED